MKRRFIAWLVACVAVASLFGCGTASLGDDGNITVIFIPKLTGNAFFEAANVGAQGYAARNGFLVKYWGDPEADASLQIEKINQAIEEKADAICVSSVDATALDDALKEAMAAGIKVVTWDADVSADARQLMVSQGTPNQLGELLVEMGAKSLADRGKNPAEDVIRYAWHYAQDSAADQQSWQEAGEVYIHSRYPHWVNVAEENYYSLQDAQRAVSVGEEILDTHDDIDLIICNDSTALPGQAQAAKNKGLTAEDVTITGFASPNSMRQFCKEGIVTRWGLWDCQVQASIGCYLAYYLATGHAVDVGDRVDIPEIGMVEIMPNTVLDSEAVSLPGTGVILLPERTEFTAENVDNYDF
jgi:AI-2 transport system substrate-binding protein